MARAVEDKHKNSLVKHFIELLYTPQPSLQIAWIRIVVFSYFIYKLLSRDYTNFVGAPIEVLSIYPTHLFKAGYDALGFPFIVDLATFHWLHWFLPFPNEPLMAGIQWAAILSCALTVIFGAGPKRLFPILSYVLISYLWGYNWRSGADVDAVFLPMQLILLYCFFRSADALTLWKPAKPLSYTRDNGWYFSMTLIVFSLYYFYAGLNKVIDISPLGWFQYDLFDVVRDEYLQMQLGYFKSIPTWAEWMGNLTYLNAPAVIISYLFELTIPVMFFRRDWIPTYAAFFITFHIFTWGVGILFFGMILLWLCFIPVHRFFTPVAVIWDSQCGFCARSLQLFRRLNWLGLLNFIGSDEAKNQPSKWTIGWTPDIVENAMWVKSVGGSHPYVGFYAFRRMVWGIPLLWVLLPGLYLPGLPFVGVRVYQYIAANRYKLGCNSQTCSLS